MDGGFVPDWYAALDRSHSDTDQWVSQPDATLSVLSAPFSLTFEHGPSGLRGTRDWQWGTIRFRPGSACGGLTKYPPLAGYSGTAAWGTMLNDCFTGYGNAEEACRNGNPADDSVLSFRVRLPARAGQVPVMQYRQWIDFSPEFDWAEVRVDGTVVTQICGETALPHAQWIPTRIDLGGFAGKTVTVTFHFLASPQLNDAGWYIDDLSVTYE